MGIESSIEKSIEITWKKSSVQFDFYVIITTTQRILFLDSSPRKNVKSNFRKENYIIADIVNTQSWELTKNG